MKKYILFVGAAVLLVSCGMPANPFQENSAQGSSSGMAVSENGQDPFDGAKFKDKQTLREASMNYIEEAGVLKYVATSYGTASQGDPGSSQRQSQIIEFVLDRRDPEDVRYMCKIVNEIGSTASTVYNLAIGDVFYTKSGDDQEKTVSADRVKGQLDTMLAQVRAFCDYAGYYKQSAGDASQYSVEVEEKDFAWDGGSYFVGEDVSVVYEGTYQISMTNYKTVFDAEGRLMYGSADFGMQMGIGSVLTEINNATSIDIEYDVAIDPLTPESIGYLE